MKFKELKNLFEVLNIKPQDAIRKNEKEFKDKNLKDIFDDEKKVIEAIIQYPKILERPIIVIEGKAVIGRPPENIYDII